MSDYNWADDPDFQRKYSLRRAVYFKFNKPDEEMGISITELARLLGYATASDLKRHQSIERRSQNAPVSWAIWPNHLQGHVGEG